MRRLKSIYMSKKKVVAINVMPNQLFCIRNVKRLKTNSFNIMQARLGPKIPRMSNVAHVDNDLLQTPIKFQPSEELDQSKQNC